MKSLKYIFLLLIIASCNTPKAVYDYDNAIQFDQISTYGIYPDLVTNLNQLDEQRLLSILKEEMQEEGFTTSENPEILVNFYASEFETQARNSLGIGVGGTGRNMGVGVSGGIPLGGNETYLRLVFDFINAKSDSLIWQAVVEGKFDKNTSPEKREAQLRKMVDKALDGYPPKK